MLLISIRPLFNYSPKYISYIQLPNQKYLNTICFIFSFFSIISLIKIIPSLKEGMIGLILDSSSVADIYASSTYNRMNQSTNEGYNILSLLGNTSVTIIPFLFFIYLLQEKKSRLIMWLLTISLLIPPLNGIAHASRLSIISSFLIVIFLTFALYPFFNMSTRKKIKKGMIVVSSFFGIMFVLITVGRSSMSTQSSIFFGFMRYFAEGPIVFNNYCMDAGGTREGEYTFAFQHILDRKSQPNESELRERFSHLKIDSSRFYTYVGDFVLDYGPIIAAIIFVVIFLIVYNKTIIKKRTVSFSQLILLYILIQYCCGFYQYQFSMKAGNLNLVVLLVMYFISKYLQGNYRNLFYKVNMDK